VSWNPELLVGELFAGVMMLCWILYIARAALRTTTLPVCWSCGATKVRRARSHTAPGLIFSMGFLKAYRCRGCRVHFYGFHTHRQLAVSAGYDAYADEVTAPVVNSLPTASYT
jgi:hypothetical protein